MGSSELGMFMETSLKIRKQIHLCRVFLKACQDFTWIFLLFVFFFIFVERCFCRTTQVRILKSKISIFSDEVTRLLMVSVNQLGLFKVYYNHEQIGTFYIFLHLSFFFARSSTYQPLVLLLKIGEHCQPSSGVPIFNYFFGTSREF